MNVTEEKKFTGGAVLKSVVVFLLNFMVQVGILLLSVFLNHRGEGAFSRYVADNLSAMFFTVGCTFLLYWIIYLYYFFEDRTFLIETKNVWLIFLVMDVGLIISQLTGAYLHVYARPAALFALLILFLVNYRSAVFLNVIFSVTVFLFDVFSQNTVGMTMTNQTFCAFMVCFIGGMFALFFAKSVKTRGGVLSTGFIVALPTLLIIFLLEITAYSPEESVSELLRLLGYGLGGSLASAVLVFAVLPFFEIPFSVLTVFRLRELTSADAKLLKRLKEEAPGTFNHSMVVAQLVESCASAIGENVELARAAAYYHDVGKLREPEFFTENQGEHNLHDELTPELSADIIRSHTKDGYDLITAYHLPKFFAEVALEHHGTLPIKYFYAKALRMSDGEISEENYSYLGPKPHSKIAALVMVADACEAATRSLSDRSPENVQRAVDGIMRERMDLEQFSECDLTMNDFRLTRDTLISALTGVYHHRIKYPKINFSHDGVTDEGDTHASNEQ